MKKTIIAAAVAASVAAPAAFADVSISGMVNPEMATQNDDSVDFTTNTDLVFKGSEDLGNGMKASFKYHLFHDGKEDEAGTGNDHGGKVADTSVTLSGDFGAVTVGRQETMHEGVMQAFVNIDASHDADLENTINNASIGDRDNGSIKYMSPNMNGFSMGVQLASKNDTDDDAADVSDVMVKYSNGGITVMAEQIDVDGGAQATAFAASYKMGDIEVRALTRTHETSAGVETDTDFLGVKYNMGNIALAAGTIDDDTNGDADIYSVAYKFSKRTSVYAVLENSDATAEDQTVIGLKHTF